MALSIEAHAVNPSKEGEEGDCEFEPSQPGVIFISVRLQAPNTPTSDCTKIHKTNKTTAKSKSSKKEKALLLGLESRLIQGFLRGPDERTMGTVVVLQRDRLGKV